MRMRVAVIRKIECRINVDLILCHSNMVVLTITASHAALESERINVASRASRVIGKIIFE